GEKAAWLKDEAGRDGVIHSRPQPLRKPREAAPPKGLAVYFDTVGGHHLQAALRRMNTRGRIPVCGFISGYNSGHSSVSNLPNSIYSRVMLRGFVATDFMHLYADFQRDMRGWLKAGQVKYQETVMDGIASAPAALIG